MNRSYLLIMSLISCLAGAVSLSVEVRFAYAAPYSDVDVTTAYNMMMNGSYPDLVVLDVRTESEYDEGHIYKAVWIPVTELESRIDELEGHEDHEVIVYCKSGGRSVTASNILDSHNFTKVYNMLGGITAWQSAGYPVWIATVHNLNSTISYDTVQAAVDAPQTLDYHVILVESGIYYEYAVISKSLHLIGEGSNQTIIDGNGTYITIFNVTACNVTIRGFTIQNDSAIYGFEGGGIYMVNSNNSNIVNNIIKNTKYGINLRNSTSNIIKENMITENDVGIQFIEDSANNTIYHNNFVNNSLQIHNIEGAPSNWDNGCEGNYWSNYNGTDLDGDGVGDEYLPWEEVDHYPLMNRYWNPCDINHDLIVDMNDVSSAAKAFGTRPGNPDWNCHADITGRAYLKPDDIVDMRDISLIAKCFGEIAP